MTEVPASAPDLRRQLVDLAADRLPWSAVAARHRDALAASTHDVWLTSMDGGRPTGLGRHPRHPAASHCPVEVVVDRRYEGCGIGSALAEAVEVSLARHAAVVGLEPSDLEVAAFGVDCTDPRSERFAASRGLAVPAWARASPADGAWTVDVALAARLAPPPGHVVRAGTVDDLDDLVAAFAWWATDNDVEGWTDGSWGDEVAACLADGWVTVVLHDEAIVGATWAEPACGTSIAVSQRLVVAPEHRGRGLGRALKSAQAAAVRAAGVRTLATFVAGGSRANACWAAIGARGGDHRPWSRPAGRSSQDGPHVR